MHPEALNEQGKTIWPKLKNFGDFCLVGGTALALQIGHRISVDFDFFKSDYLEKELLDKVEKVFVGQEVRALVNNAEELTVLINGVKVTFLRYPFPLGDKVEIEGIAVLAIKEIAATKAYTIGRRGSFKDYADLYFILRGGYLSLGELIRLAEEKYQHEFNGRLFLEQLVFLMDIEDTEILFLKETIGKDELEKFFAEEIKKVEL